MPTPRLVLSKANVSAGAVVAGKLCNGTMPIHALHQPHMPIPEPHFPNGEYYVPARFDAQQTYTVAPGHTLFVTPEFGSKWQGYALDILTSDLLTLPINMGAVLDDSITGTGGPWATKGTILSSLVPVGNLNPYNTYGLATFPLTQNSGPPALGQLLGGFFEAVVTTPLNATAVVTVLDDSNDSIGRKSALLRAQERGSDWNSPSNQGPVVRNICVATSMQELMQNFQPTVMPGLQSERFHTSITPRTVHTHALGSPHDMSAGTWATYTTSGSAACGCCSVYNPVFGYAQTGAGVVIQNPSATDNITVVIRAHFACAIVPTTSAGNVDNSMVHISKLLVPGKSASSGTMLIHTAQTPASTHAAANMPQNAPKPPTPPVIAAPVPHQNFFEKVGNTISEGWHGLMGWIRDAENTHIGQELEQAGAQRLGLGGGPANPGPQNAYRPMIADRSVLTIRDRPMAPVRDWRSAPVVEEID